MEITVEEIPIFSRVSSRLHKWRVEGRQGKLIAYTDLTDDEKSDPAILKRAKEAVSSKLKDKSEAYKFRKVSFGGDHG